jgi:hypothetical protein
MNQINFSNLPSSSLTQIANKIPCMITKMCIHSFGRNCRYAVNDAKSWTNINSILHKSEKSTIGNTYCTLIFMTRSRRERLEVANVEFRIGKCNEKYHLQLMSWSKRSQKMTFTSIVDMFAYLQTVVQHVQYINIQDTSPLLSYFMKIFQTRHIFNAKFEIQNATHQFNSDIEEYLDIVGILKIVSTKLKILQISVTCNYEHLPATMERVDFANVKEFHFCSAFVPVDIENWQFGDKMKVLHWEVIYSC